MLKMKKTAHPFWECPTWYNMKSGCCKSTVTRRKRSHGWGTNSQAVEQRFHSPAVRKLSLPLSLLSRAEKHTHTHTLLSLHFLTVSLPTTSSSSVMNGRYEFSTASLGFSLRPSAAEQTTCFQLKGTIKNLFEPCTFGVYLCMVLKWSRRDMENRFL